MDKFKFKNIQLESIPKFNANQLFLWVWKPESIPPHVGISIGECYFALTVKGKEEKQVKNLLQQIKRQKTTLLWINLSNESKVVTEDILRNIYSTYTRAGERESTCSSPVFDLFSAPRSVVKLDDFLQFIEHKIGQVSAVNVTSEFRQIPNYDIEDIRSKISKLQKK